MDKSTIRLTNQAVSFFIQENVVKYLPMQVNVEKLPKSTLKLTITVPSDKILEEFNHVINHFVDEAEIPGFRKGNAPKAMVEEKIDQGKLNGEVINHILPESFRSAVSEHHIYAISSPKIMIKQLEKGKDFIYEAEVATIPEVKIGDYKNKVKEALSNVTKETEKDKVGVALKALNDCSEVDLSPVLVNEEIERMLSRFLDQLGHLGLTVDRYLTSIGKKPEDLRNDYATEAEKNLKLEFILSKLIIEEKIEVTDEEIKKAIEATPDEKTRIELEKPEQKAYIRAVLAKQKMIDRLLNV